MYSLVCYVEVNIIRILIRFHGYAYDGNWAIARSTEAVPEECKLFNKSLVDFEYK